ncbi:MAG: NfeD family protein [Halobacteriaceae archaeon]
MAEVFGTSLALLLTVAGIALVIGEALAPGAHFIVLGVALLVAGLVGLLVPALATPLVLAVLVVGVGAATLWGYRRFDVYGVEAGRTADSTSLRGKEATVVQRVTSTSGRVRLREGGGFDPTYSARSVDGEIPEGETVIVVDPGGGSVLTVESIDGADDIDRELARERARRKHGSTREADADREGARE